MNIRSFAFAFLVCSSSISAPTLAAADSAAEDPVTTIARARWREGVDFYDKGQFEQARASFMQAYALKKHPAVLLNLAWSCFKGGHPFEAYRYFKQFESESKDITDKQRADVSDGEHQAMGQLGQIDVAAPAGTSIAIDGVDAGTTPLKEPVVVEPGAHTLKFTAADGSEVKSVTVLGGEKTVVRFQKTPVAEAPPPASTVPAPIPPTPAPEVPPTPPTAPTQAAPPPPPSEPRPEVRATNAFSPPANLVPVFLLGGLAVASYATAIGLYVVKQSATDKANQAVDDINTLAKQQNISLGGACLNQPQGAIAIRCSALSTDNDDINSDALWGNIALGIGIAATAGTLVYWLVSEKNSPTVATSNTLITPIVGPRLGGLSLTGSF